MVEVVQNLRKVQAKIADRAKLVAVSKTKSVEAILEAYHVGQRAFGENRVQELVAKHAALPQEIEWHMIGHLQSNKVKYIAPFISLIHGVDKTKLLMEINRQAEKNSRVIPVLLQFHIAKEDTKYGFSYSEAHAFLSSAEYRALQHVEVVGVMGMATFTDDALQIRQEFRNLKEIFDRLKGAYFRQKSSFKEISMGMSGDFEMAIEAGSTMVRVGSTIFGMRG